jgi:hypothetical protein
MQEILEIMKSDIFTIALVCLNVLLLIGYIVNVIKISKIKSKYNNFMKKFSKSSSIEEDLNRYVQDVELLKEENQRVLNYCKNLDDEIDNCIQKIGIVRYSAFKDTGSDLSFALAMLDEKNDGVLLNGIYSREMSNIYGKPIKNGKSEYTLSKEEEEAIYKAINSNN